MIKVEREEKGQDGRYRYTVPGYAVEGLSREPLLDACRQLKSMGVDTGEEISLSRAGRSEWDLRTTVGKGASLTVVEGWSTIFRKYRSWLAGEEGRAHQADRLV